MNLNTILGIFTAITFAIFGGLQLLGNVFGSVLSSKNISNYAIGNAIILCGFIIAIYIILCALFAGIKSLQNEQYSFNRKRIKLIIFSSVVVILCGIIYSHL